MSQKPAHALYDGHLKVTIWRNVNSEKGTTWYSLNPSRSYKNGDDMWRDTDSLGSDDALIMAELLREAYAWVKMQRRADAKARRDKEKESQASAA